MRHRYRYLFRPVPHAPPQLRFVWEDNREVNKLWSCLAGRRPMQWKGCTSRCTTSYGRKG